MKKADDALLKAVSHDSTAILGFKYEFPTDSLADASKAANPQSKSGSSLVQAIWLQVETRWNCKLLTKLSWFFDLTQTSRNWENVNVKLCELKPEPRLCLPCF